MNTPTKELEKTAILSGNETGRKKTRRNNPKLFVCCETDIFMASVIILVLCHPKV